MVLAFRRQKNPPKGRAIGDRTAMGVVPVTVIRSDERILNVEESPQADAGFACGQMAVERHFALRASRGDLPGRAAIGSTIQTVADPQAM